MGLRRGITALLLFFASVFALMAQDSSKDSLVRLVYADKAQQVEEYGVTYRRVTGNVDFLHNNAHLYCDSASWNMDFKYIEAFGNVRIAQDKTMLKSEQLLYNIDESTAHFNGGVVELYDKDGHILRTMQLDYNTRDSVGFFFNGGAMKDSDGNVIESVDGTYRTGPDIFEFNKEVQMYMDSIRIRTTRLLYEAGPEVAHFGESTYMWKDDGFLFSDSGWYDRRNDLIHFEENTYMNDPSYEAWSDSLFYNQSTGEINLYRNSQILDTTHRSYYTGNHIRYERDTVDGVVTMSERPAVIFFGENENNVVDTLYFGADTIRTYVLRKSDIPQQEIDEARQRYDDITFDTLQKKREEQAAEREKKRKEKLRANGKLPPEGLGPKRTRDSVAVGSVADSTAIPDGVLPHSPGIDSVRALPDVDSVSSNAADSTALAMAPPDTTHIRYMFAYRNVKAYRSDVQAACDTLVFTAIDSVARMYGRPIMWNEVKNQLTSETMYFLMRNGNLHRGNMVTDAWIISQEDSVHFNQIKCTEMMGFFHENKLYRFDALGGVNALFYLDEKGELTTVNIKDSKSMSAMIKDGNARRMLYMESVKSDAYPILELESEKHRLKEFSWRGDERPVSRYEITDVEPRPSQRDKYADVITPEYPETNLYFDNYMRGVLDTLEARRLARIERQRVQDSIDAARRHMEQLEKDSTALASAAVPASDSLSVASADKSSEELLDRKIADDTHKKLTRAEKRALKKAERKARREARKAARKARREARREARNKARR